MYILGINAGHDASATLMHDGKLVAYCKEERLTRKKQDAGKPLRQKSIDEVLHIAGISRDHIDVVVLERARLPSRCFLKSERPMRLLWRKLVNRSNRLNGEMRAFKTLDEFTIVDKDKIRKCLGVKKSAEIIFKNHHYSHNIGCYYLSGWKEEAVFLAVDAGGDFVCHAAYNFNDDKIDCLYGGDDFIFKQKYNYGASIGIAYSLVTKLLGYRPNRHEGKLTGLAAYGKPVVGDKILQCFVVEKDLSVTSPFKSVKELELFLQKELDSLSPEDSAASIQFALEKHIVEMVRVLYEIYPFKKIGLSGGVFANVKLNQEIAKLDFVEEVFVIPPMGDEGQSLGNAIAAWIEQKGFNQIDFPVFKDVYLGRAYGPEDLEQAAVKHRCLIQHDTEPAKLAATLLAQNKIGAIFEQRMEMGPRALGARSIIASPAQGDLNHTLNERLNRTEFMPFAPYVCDIDADQVFQINNKTRRCCEFMTITTDVNDSWRSKIPDVVHVDGTARPQVIERETNPLYYDILVQFKELTGLPCLVNTSFNAHEEPIINTPDEAVQALLADRIDFLVCNKFLVFKKSGGHAIN